jgi:tetratricopeptide (TPR) repeat protein
MKFIATLASLLLCLAASPVNAQSGETVSTATASSSAATRASTQPNMANLLESVNNVANELQNNLKDLEASIQDSRDSQEKGAKVLDEMLASVTAVHQNMAEDGAIWKELDSLLELWEQRRKETLQKSESNPAFVPIAKAWQDKINTARELRKQISTERANSMALMRSIEADREIVLAYYDLGQADKAIEGLQKVGANLSNLNNNMQKIVKTASSVDQQQPIPQ